MYFPGDKFGHSVLGFRAGPAAHAAHAVLEPLAELRGPAGPGSFSDRNLQGAAPSEMGG